MFQISEFIFPGFWNICKLYYPNRASQIQKSELIQWAFLRRVMLAFKKFQILEHFGFLNLGCSTCINNLPLLYLSVVILHLRVLLFYYFLLSTLDWTLYEKNTVSSLSLLCLSVQRHCLQHSRCSINICWLNKWIQGSNLLKLSIISGKGVWATVSEEKWKKQVKEGRGE